MRSTTSRLAALTLGLALAATGCAGPAEETDTAPEAPASTPSESPTRESPSPTKSPEEPSSAVLEVTVEGDRVTPNAQQVELAVGEELMVEVTSERAGELHVHSKPEQYVEFGAGTTRHRLVVETPGTVEVEEHESGAVVAVLEVR